jgi:uncharacterized membrane protein (UPF0127 family)
MILRNGTTGSIVADRVHLATDLISRLAGFLARRSVGDYEGLVFPRCRIIHTFGMRAPIDVLFLDGSNRVVRHYDRVGSNRILIGPPGARHTVELGASPEGTRDVLSGDVLIME